MEIAPEPADDDREAILAALEAAEHTESAWGAAAIREAVDRESVPNPRS